MSLTPAALSFLNSGKTEMELLESLWFGIEIEFSDGGELCVELSDEDVENSINEHPAYFLASRYGYGSDGAQRLANRLLRVMTVRDFVERCCQETSWRTVLDSHRASMPESLSEWIDVQSWEHCEDGTSGIQQEYKTESPMVFSDIVNAVNRLVDVAGDDACVPINGSNHVHVSIPGCHHSVSDKSVLHCCILFELSQFVDEFPELLKTRLRGDDQYFRLSNVATSKYTAVHCHSSGTWEFRLFGHMFDVDDITACIRIAGLALLRGYKRFADRRYSIGNVASFRELFKNSIRQFSAMDSCDSISQDDDVSDNDDNDDDDNEAEIDPYFARGLSFSREEDAYASHRFDNISSQLWSSESDQCNCDACITAREREAQSV